LLALSHQSTVRLPMLDCRLPTLAY